jgi:hypothetical protein
MRAATHALWMVPLAAVAGAALGQTTGGIGSATGNAPMGGTAIGSTAGTPAAGQVRGPGLPAVPNNNLPPITTPAPITGSITPGVTTTAPGIPTTTPGIPTRTPGIASPTPSFGTSPSFGGSASTDSFISLSPPIVSTPSSPNSIRPCPSGMTFC